MITVHFVREQRNLGLCGWDSFPQRMDSRKTLGRQSCHVVLHKLFSLLTQTKSC